MQKEGMHYQYLFFGFVSIFGRPIQKEYTKPHSKDSQPIHLHPAIVSNKVEYSHYILAHGVAV